MNDTYIVLAVSIVATIIQAIFWRWVAILSSSQDDNRVQINQLKAELAELRAEIYRDYPSKNDMHKDYDRIMQSLQKIENDIEKIGDKLDTKVDKS